MSNYTKTTDFEAKDSLPSGDSGKIIRGSEFETEFDNIATAIASKSDANNPTFTGTVTIDGLTVNGNTVLGNAATDTVTVTADIASNLIPSADDTYNLGASGAEWNDLFIDGTANIDSLVAGSGSFTSISTTGNVTFGDNDKAIFGAGSDLEIYHDGSGSFINDTGTGDLHIRASNTLRLQNSAGQLYAYGFNGGEFALYHNNAQKLATTSTGIDVTGVITTDGMTTSADINFGDNDKAVFGAGSDLQIFSNGTSSYIMESGSGNLEIRATDIFVKSADNTKALATFDADGASSFSHNGSTKLETTSTGVDVTGTVTADDLTIDGAVVVNSDTTTGITVTQNANTDVNGLMGIRINNSTGTTYAAFGNSGANSVAITAGDAGGTGNTSLTFKTAASGSEKSRLNIGSGGDISFYEDTGTTAKLFWDASAESLGIGTSSPASGVNLQVHEAGSGQTLMAFTNDTTGAGSNDGLHVGIDSGENAFIYNKENTAVYFGTNNTERMRITSAGNVGIGTNSPRSLINASSATGAILTLESSDTTLGENDVVGQIDFYANDASTNSTGNKAFIKAYAETAGGNKVGLDFATSGSASATGVVAMTIDSNGNLLVGTTNVAAGVGNTDTGHSFGSSGYATISRTGTATQSTLFLNKNTNDGSILEFRKDGSTVGSIGSNPSSYLYIGNGDTTLSFSSASDLIYPTGTSGAQRDGFVSLGNGANRFKDLYLSGGAYLGGTAAANKLDDYEVGSFTPTVRGSTSAGTATYTAQGGTYEKVGDMVHFRIFVYWTSGTGTGNLEISNLPFTASSALNSYESCAIGYVRDVTFSGTLTAYVDTGGAYIVFRENQSAATGSSLAYDAAGRIMVSGSYRAA